MRRIAGQAARHGGRFVHALVQFAVGLAVMACVLAAGAAWRLGRGPVEMDWLVPMLEAQVNGDPSTHLALGGAAIAWEGFQGGLDQPIDVRLSGLVLSDAAGRRILAVPHAAVTLSPGWLLFGRIVPRAVVLDDVRLYLLRDADGGLRLDLPGATPAAEAGPGPDVQALLRAFAARPRSDRARGPFVVWSQLRRIRLRGAAAEVTDRQVATTWTVPSLQLDLHRRDEGGVTGSLRASVALRGVAAQVVAVATLDAAGRRMEVHLRTSPVVPAALARVLPQAAPLSGIDAPLVLAGSAVFGAGLAPERVALDATLGAGTLHLGAGAMPVVAAEAVVAGTQTQLTAVLSRFVTAPAPDRPQTTVTGHAEAEREPDGSFAATAAVAVDRVSFADLPALWPVGLGGPGTRPWVTQNITAGEVHDFRVNLALRTAADLSDVTLTRLSGGGDASDLTVHWLRPVPPIVHGTARLTFLDPDSLEVTASGGTEAIGAGGIAIRGGRVLFTKLQAKDQFADISADLAGPVPAALALLNQKRIGLLARSPLPVNGAEGTFAGTMTLAHMVLRDDLAMDDLMIGAALHLEGVRIPGLVAGRDLDRGMLDLTAHPDGLHIAGTAQLAGIPGEVAANIDFRAGPPTQVLESVTAKGTLDTGQLARFGLSVAPFADGSAQVSARLALRRNATGTAEIAADLADTSLALDLLSWAKPRGRAARVEATLALDRDGIAAVDRLSARGDGLLLAAAVPFAGGRPAALRIDRLALGNTTDAHGTIGLPAQPGAPWRLDLAGPSIDASSLLRRDAGKPAQPAAKDPAYSATTRFDRVILGPDRRLDGVTATVESDGTMLRRLDLAGRTTEGEPFRLRITPSGQGRALSGNAADAGGLLRALDVVPSMHGGTLALEGHYDDTAPDHPLAGQATIESFRVRGAPALAKLLQAMTLYGLVDAVRGPGLGFTKLVAPFRLADNVLTLQDARAFSPSLGMTAKGRLDLRQRVFDMEGTIVPAYFFNSLLGGLPLIGRMFSPERGGGVFAATYTLRGPMADPHVGINPLAALTPGFLRGLFGVLDHPAPAR